MQLMNLMEGAPLLARLGWETAQRDPDEFIDVAKRHWPAVGTADEAVERLRPLIDAGVELFLFEHFLQLDSVGLELLATEVMPKKLRRRRGLLSARPQISARRPDLRSGLHGWQERQPRGLHCWR